MKHSAPSTNRGKPGYDILCNTLEVTEDRVCKTVFSTIYDEKCQWFTVALVQVSTVLFRYSAFNKLVVLIILCMPKQYQMQSKDSGYVCGGCGTPLGC